MVKIKQVASRRPEPASQTIKTPKTAIKSAQSNNPFSSDSHLPPSVQQILAARKHALVPPSGQIMKKIKKDVVPSTRFLNFSIPKRPFQRLVRDIAYKYVQDCRFTQEALEALQISSEDFMVGFFNQANFCMEHCKRKTLMVKDMELAAKLRGIDYEPL